MRLTCQIGAYDFRLTSFKWDGTIHNCCWSDQRGSGPSRLRDYAWKVRAASILEGPLLPGHSDAAKFPNLFAIMVVSLPSVKSTGNWLSKLLAGRRNTHMLGKASVHQKWWPFIRTAAMILSLWYLSYISPSSATLPLMAIRGNHCSQGNLLHSYWIKATIQTCKDGKGGSPISTMVLIRGTARKSCACLKVQSTILRSRYCSSPPQGS